MARGGQYRSAMGITTQVFRLYQSTSVAGCVHTLVARAAQPGYPNADAGAEDAAHAFASSALDHLTTWWARWLLPVTCRSEHTGSVIAETCQVVFDGSLADDLDLRTAEGLRDVDVWVATGERAGRVVLGVARDEAAFWAAVDDDHAGRVEPRRPARLLHAYLVTDLDGSGDLRDA
jgi:hypothetical protein